MKKLIAVLLAVPMSVAALCCVGSPVTRPAGVRCEGVFGSAERVAGIDPAGNGLFLDGTTLYCGAGTELCVLDVSVPERPQVLSRVCGIGRLRQIVARDGIVYAAARETGVWVIDARKPTSAQVVTRFDSVELATGLALAGDVLFVAQRNNGVEFVDVSDFRRPAHIDIRKTPESQSVAYADGWLYSGEWGAGGVTVFDAHDMSAVREVAFAPLRGYGDGVAVFGNRLFAATGHHRKDKSKAENENYGLGHGLEVFDISQPQAPRFLSRVGFPKLFRGGQDWWTVRPSADGRTVFAADTFNGVFAVDVSDAAKPRVAGRLVVETPNGGRKKASPEAISYLAVGSNVVYFTALNYGLGVVRCPLAKPYASPTGTPPVRPEARKAYATPAKSRFAAWLPPERVQVRGAAAYGKYVYAACGAAGLWALERDGKGGLSAVRRLAPKRCADVAIRDGRLYSAEDFDGVAVYDLGDPLNLRERARSTTFAGEGINSALWVTAPAGRHAVVSNRGRYFILDAQTLVPTGKSFSHCPGWGRYVAEDVVGGRYLALHGCNSGFGWIDLGGAEPCEIGYSRVNKCGQADNACAFRGDRLLRMSRGTLQLLRPGQAAEETPWKGVAVPGKCTGYPSWDGGNRLALTSRIGRAVAMVDVTDETKPRVLWQEKLAGNPDRSFFFEGRLVVPCGYQGLLIER